MNTVSFRDITEDRIQSLPLVNSVQLTETDAGVEYLTITPNSTTKEDITTLESILRSVAVNYLTADSFTELKLIVNYNADSNTFEVYPDNTGIHVDSIE